MASDNPIADYKEKQGLSLIALADLLGTSKGHASDLVNGKVNPGKKIASRMEELTGKPWWKFLAPPTSSPRAPA